MAEDWLVRLASRHGAQLRAYLSRFSENDADIDDWVQEALLRVFAASHNDTLDDPRAYLFRTARNVALTRIAHRKIKRLSRVEIAQMERQRVEAAPLHRLLQRRLDYDELMAAIASLPERCREVFVLCKIEGFSHREIAEKLEISVSTVEKHLVKGLKLCRSVLLPVAVQRDAAEEDDSPAARPAVTGDPS